jgi:hypothetical protein
MKLSIFLLLCLFRIEKACSFSIVSHTTKSVSSLCSSSYDEWDTPDVQDFEDGEEDGRSSEEDLRAVLGDWDERVAKFNTVHLVGRIGNAPEPRYFDDGKVVVNLSLACRRKYHYAERQALNIKSGEEETDWFGLEIWGQTAEVGTEELFWATKELF